MQIDKINFIGLQELFTLEDIKIAWAAGILEGEGCFSNFKRKDRASSFNQAIHLEMTDEDAINSVLEIFKVGTVNLRKNISGRKDSSKRKPTWIWSVQNKKDIFGVLMKVSPFMSIRRREKISEMVEILEERGL